MDAWEPGRDRLTGLLEASREVSVVRNRAIADHHRFLCGIGFSRRRSRLSLLKLDLGFAGGTTLASSKPLALDRSFRRTGLRPCLAPFGDSTTASVDLCAHEGAAALGLRLAARGCSSTTK